MDDEFALCWNNFQDNIATGFQNLYDRGDLVDVTLACDGKLLQAHKIVLAICSPYFQEIFVSNPCKHPIIILNDVTYTVMSELLQFMYQGVVNVKHTDLSAFMKIAQALQIKGLTTSMQRPSVTASPSLHNMPCTAKSGIGGGGGGASTSSAGDASGLAAAYHPNTAGNNVIETKISSALFGAGNSGSMKVTGGGGGGGSSVSGLPSDLSSGQKRSLDYGGGGGSGGHMDASAIGFGKKVALRRGSEVGFGHGAGGMSGAGSDHEMHGADSMENMSSDEAFMPPIPQISMLDGSRFDLNNVKRESMEPMLSPGAVMRGLGPPPFSFEYNTAGMYGGAGGSGGGGVGGGANSSASSVKNVEFPNELHMGGDFGASKGGPGGSVNHMDIPAVAPGEKWTQGKLQFMLSQRGKPLLVHDGHSFGIQYIRKDKKYWQCNLSRKFNCKARVTTTETGEIIVTNNEHCHTEIRQHLRKDYKHQKNAGWPETSGAHPSSVSAAAAAVSVAAAAAAAATAQASTAATSAVIGGENSGIQHPTASGADFMRQIVSTAANASMAVNRMIADNHQRQFLAAAEAAACANPPPAHQIHSHHPTWPYKNGLDA